LALTRRPDPGALLDVLEMVDVAQPVPGPREVLVKVHASTINIDDIHVAEGTFYGGIPMGKRPRRDRPVTPGSDLAGVVVAVGRDVRSIQIGECVFGVQTPFHAGGAWAEFCAVDHRWITRKPDALSFGTAAACGVSGLVALSAINALKLRAKQRVVVVGASGGIGAMAVQLAHRAGAEVIGVCGPANSERAYKLGCSRVLDYKRGAWDRALLAEEDPHVDRVLDLVGGRDTEQMAWRVLRKAGIFVTVVGPERFIGDQPLGWKRILSVLLHVAYRIVSSRLRGPRYVLAGPGPGGGKALSNVASAAAAGVLPPIDCAVPFNLEAMREGIRRAVAHQNNGRIVIEMET
jgi:NADPH:quinone reductase-like Zn-dependent oxidoreductase